MVRKGKMQEGPAFPKKQAVTKVLDKIVGATPIGKGQYEKIPGTRIQLNKAGVHIRVVVEDGKEFKPENVRAARQHLLKVAKHAAEQAEIKAKIDGTDPVPTASVVEKVQASLQAQKSKSGKTGNPGEKKKPIRDASAMSSEERAERWRKSVELHVAKAVSEGRQVVTPAVVATGHVLQRAKGFAWVKLQTIADIPENVMQRVRVWNIELRGSAEAAGAAAFCDGADGDIISVDFADVVQEGFRVEPGVALNFKLYLDKRGVGGYDAVPAV